MDAWYPQLVALLQIVIIDVVLAGDNAVVVGMAAASTRSMTTTETKA